MVSNAEVRLLPILVLLALLGILLAMFAFILGRRSWRTRRFRRLDRFRDYWLGRLPDLLAGEIPGSGELASPEARETLETLLLDRLQTAGKESKQLFSIAIERIGLLEGRIQLLRRGSRWERLHSAAVLGRMCAPAAVPALLEALQDSWPRLRTAAVRSLGMIASPAAGPALLQVLQQQGLPTETNIWLDAAVACNPDPQAFLPLLCDVRPELRTLGARAMGESAAPPRFESLDPLAFDPEPEVRAQVLRALGRCGDQRAVPVLIAAANDPVWFVRLRALSALVEVGAMAALGAVLCATRDQDFRVRRQAAATLAGLATRPAEILQALLSGNDRYGLEGYLSELARAGLLWRTMPLLRAPLEAVRRNAEDLLSRAVAAGSHQEVLYAVEAHPDWRVRLAAARLLARAGAVAAKGASLEGCGPRLLPEVEQRLAACPSARLRRVLRWNIRALESGAPQEGRRALAGPV